MSYEIPLACDMSVFTPEQRAQHEKNAAEIAAVRQSIVELDDGYAFKLPGSAYTLAAEFIRLEHMCCPFLRLVLEVEPGQNSVWLSLRGEGPIKAFVREEIGLA